MKPSKPLFERLRQGLTEGIQHSRGRSSLRTTMLLGYPPEMTPEELIALRLGIDDSRAAFLRGDRLEIDWDSERECT